MPLSSLLLGVLSNAGGAALGVGVIREDRIAFSGRY